MVKRDIQNIQNNELINLGEASCLYGYTQHHFGLLCRQGKLKAERVGKKWFTTRGCIESYMGGVEEKYKTTLSHYTKLQEKFPIKKEFLPVSLEPLPAIKIPPAEFIPKLNTMTPLMAGTRLVVASSFVLILAVFSYFGILSARSFDYREFSVGLANSAQKIAVATGELIENPPVEIVSFFEGTRANFMDFSKDIGSFNTGSLSSVSSSWGGTLRHFIFATGDNLFAFGADLKCWGADFKKWVWNRGDSIKLVFWDNEDIDVDVYVRPQEPESPETREGMVILPQSDVGANILQFKRDIQSVFSDNVVVQPDEEGDAGIIQPIFKKGKGEEYLYVMVPVEKEVEKIISNDQ